MDANPYQPPLSPEQARPAAVCNFCRQTPAGSPLVQAPEQEVYICAACARIAGGEIERYKSQSLPLALLSLVLGVSFLLLVGINWFVWHDESGIGAGVSLLGTLSGIALVGQFLSAMHARAG